MTGRRQLAAVIGVIAVVLALGVAGKMIFGSELSPLGVGSKAPNVTALTLDSVPVQKSLDEYRGQVLLVNVWATWCLPCRAEMPSIEQLHQSLGPKGLKVIGISVDDPGNDQAIRDFIKQYALTFEILKDPKGQEGEVSREFEATGYPITLVIGRDGLIRKKQLGASNWNSPENRGLIERLLADKAG